jgi:hypothetical protein
LTVCLEAAAINERATNENEQVDETRVHRREGTTGKATHPIVSSDELKGGT